MDGDALLLDQYARTQDADAFAELARRHAGLVYGTCLRVLKNVDEAEDAAQECFLKLAQHADQIRGSLPAWLHAVARNQAIKAIRKASTRRQYEEKAMADSDPVSESDWGEVSLRLDEALAELPDELREVLMLQYLEGHNERRIAEIVGVSGATICRRRQKGLKQLRAMLRRAGVTTTVAGLAALLAENGICGVPASLTTALGKMAIAGLAPVGAGAAAAAAAAGGTAMKTTIGMATAKVKATAITALVLAGLAPLAVVGILKMQTAPADVATTPVVAVDPAPPAPVEPGVVAPVVDPAERRVAQAPAGTPIPAATTPAPTPADPVQQRLGGADRYVAHVSTDKPIYRSGENVYIRAVLVHALDRKPLLTNAYGQVEILSPKGDPIFQSSATMQDGALGLNWPIGTEVAGGDYRVKVSFPNMGYPPAERSFNIRAYRQRRLRTQIDFVSEGYGPGDAVSASLQASRSEGGFPAGARATVVARVDEQEVWRGTTKINDYGYTMVDFKLPDAIREGNGTLSFAIEDGGVVETAAKSIPILMASVDLKAYPEGGEMIAGLDNRIYFEAIAPNGRPADLLAELVDPQGNVVLTAHTEHEGRGAFNFTPATETTYTLRVIDPKTIKTQVALPWATGTVGLRATRDRFGADEPVVMDVAASAGGPVRVTVSNHEVVVAEESVSIGTTNNQPAWTPIELRLPAEAGGVLRVTAYDAEGTPRAERLVWREPAKKLRVALELDRDSYVPGGKARLMVRTTDAAGKPTPGFVGLTVTDDATLEMIERRQQAPRLPVQVYLEPEVRELADARVYLSDDPKAPHDLDLLLGTQGWRRFVFVDAAHIEEFLKQHGDAARTVLAQRIWQIPMAVDGPVRLYEGGGGGVQNAEAREQLAAEINGHPVMRPVNNFTEAGKLFGGDRAQPKFEAEKADMGNQLHQLQARQEFTIPGQPVADAEQNRFRELLRISAFRVYAHAVRPDRRPDDRVDFTETLYWNAALATGEDGATSVTFDLSDAVTTFRALADGYTAGGTFGGEDKLIESRRPFYIETKAPLEATAGDKIELPIAMVNETDEAIDATLTAATSASLTLAAWPTEVTIPARTRKRIVLSAVATANVGPADLSVAVGSASYSDRITRRVPVQAAGFPIAIDKSGTLNGEISNDIAIPDNLAGGPTARAVVYPAPLANLTKALESLVRDPNGCFEQTSSTNYPLVMAMQYFDTHTGVDPDLVARSREKLDAGYKKLTGFESKEHGYEWFGANPGHEALTAYGLMQFHDMHGIAPVDDKMIERTREWLLARRDGKGGFQRSDKAIDSFGHAPEAITNAYITWALAGAGETSIGPELNAVLASANASKDPYLIGMAAGALIDAKRGAEAKPLLDRLAATQAADGSLPGAETSITRSGGESLLIETTSLAVLAWLADGGHTAEVERAMKWLASACEGGRFGSTQSTVLALKAIVAYDQSRARPKADGRVILLVDGREIEAKAFTKDSQGAIEFGDFGKTLVPGRHAVALRMEDGSPMPYSMSVEYHALQPANAETCPLRIETSIASAEVQEGEPVEVVARLRNTSAEGLPMTMLIVGMPGGLEPRHEQLQEAVKAGLFAFYEIRGRDVALYFRGLEPGADRRIVLSAIAAAPGEYTGPASRTYLYYTPEAKRWAAGLRVRIVPKW